MLFDQSRAMIKIISDQYDEDIMKNLLITAVHICTYFQFVAIAKKLSSTIKLLESPIPPAPTPSQKAHFDNISGTKRGSIDPLVSKRPEKNSE